MIASRKLERLRNTANELQQYLPANGTAELEFMECNIKNENQVIIIRRFVARLSVIYWHWAVLGLSGVVRILMGPSCFKVQGPVDNYNWCLHYSSQGPEVHFYF